MPFVYSTNSTHVGYTEYDNTAPDLPIAKRTVVVKGGANVADKRFVTPLGVCTEISDDAAAFLAQDANFIRHQKAGHVKLSAHRLDPEIPAADMRLRDGCAPLVPGDFEPGKAPTVSPPTAH
jgi:hypothetical protein